MRINFKKVSAIAASTLMVGMTMGVAAAANYPNPFVVSGGADVAIVYGTGAGVSSLDLVQAGNIESNLQSYMGAGSGSSAATISGEAISLDTSGKRIYVNSSLNAVKTVLTKADLPTVLADTSFSGNVDATGTQTIVLGSNPRVTYAKQPTSTDDPSFALQTSTSSTNYIYNATVNFDKAIAFNDSNSKGQDIVLFGQKFTVSSSTDGTNLVLLQSAQKIDLSSSGSRTQDVTIAGNKYTVDLVSASDTSATVKVTDATGASDTKSVSEASSKKIQGITIAVTSASSSTASGDSASIVAGSEKYTLSDGSSVTYGDTGTVIDGTVIKFGPGQNCGNISSLTLQVYAPGSDYDAIKAGTSLVDPVFKSFQLNFAGLNIPEDSTTARDTITITSSGSSEADLTFTDYNQNAKTFAFSENVSTSGVNILSYDSAGRNNISVVESEPVYSQYYVMLGNENNGHLVKISSVNNQTTGFSNDVLKFQDVMSGSEYTTTWTSEGVGTAIIGGQSYGITMTGASGSSDTAVIHIAQPDTTTATDLVLFPTIQTSKGAKVMLTAPVTINLGLADGTTPANVTNFLIPKGNGYTTVAVAVGAVGPNNWSFESTAKSINTSITTAGAASKLFSVGDLQFNVSNAGTNNTVKIALMNIAGTLPETMPAVVVFEEKDYNSAYHAWITDLEAVGNLGVNSVKNTWDNASSAWATSMYSNNKINKRADYWGTIASLDSSAADSYTATISYPDDQVYGQIYMASNGAVITAGQAGGATQLGDVLVTDSEVSSVSSKNLIVVGGSCINSVAASMLGATCGDDFTTKTGIGSGQFLIQSIASTYQTGKIALVVAGYEAADTVNAATYLRTQTVDTTAGKKYQGTSATTATLVTTTA